MGSLHYVRLLTGILQGEHKVVILKILC